MPVFFVGDVIDRGPDSLDVVDMLLARDARGVRGNHEEWLRDWVSGRGFNGDALHIGFGGRATLASYGVDMNSPISPQYVVVPPAHRRFFMNLPLVLDLHVDDHAYWVCHAGVNRSTTLDASVPRDEAMWWIVENEPGDLLWSGASIEHARRLDRPVIYGHVMHAKPQCTQRAIALDTCCGRRGGGPLTAVVLPEGRFISTP